MSLTDPYPYQKKGVRKLHHFSGRALLADEMGLGKTLQCLRWVLETKASPTIIVCPASLKYNWQREALIHVGMNAEVLEGQKAPKNSFQIQYPLIIINYDILTYWVKHLIKLKPKCVILDECHYIKNRGTKRYSAVKRLCSKSKHVIGVSGTPLTNRPAELWPVLNLIRNDKYPNFMEFAHEFCRPRRTPWGWKYDGATNLGQLHEELSALCMIRRRKADVLHQLPDKSRHVVPVELDDRTEYDEALKDFIGWLQKTSNAKAKRAKKAERLVQMGYLKRIAAQQKMPSVLNWIDNFLEESEEKILLFGIHKTVISQLFKKYKSDAVKIDGSTSSKNRQKAVESFQSKHGARIFIGNIQAAGVGLNLTAASTVAFCEIGWTPGEHTQGEDRLHRIGQKNATQCFYLIARNTIEEKLCRILQEKQEVLDSTLDGKAAVSKMDIYSQLERELIQDVRT